MQKVLRTQRHKKPACLLILPVQPVFRLRLGKKGIIFEKFIKLLTSEQVPCFQHLGQVIHDFKSKNALKNETLTAFEKE